MDCTRLLSAETPSQTSTSVTSLSSTPGSQASSASAMATARSATLAMPPSASVKIVSAYLKTTAMRFCSGVPVTRRPRTTRLTSSTAFSGSLGSPSSAYLVPRIVSSARTVFMKLPRISLDGHWMPLERS